MPPPASHVMPIIIALGINMPLLALRCLLLLLGVPFALAPITTTCRKTSAFNALQILYLLQEPPCVLATQDSI